jgi:hypothetical protein
MDQSVRALRQFHQSRIDLLAIRAEWARHEPALFWHDAVNDQSARRAAQNVLSRVPRG